MKTTMNDKITLKEVLELVSFVRGEDGSWCVEKVRGNIRGHVYGHVCGDVWGDVKGHVCADVRGDVGGDVLGRILGRNEDASSQE